MLKIPSHIRVLGLAVVAGAVLISISPVPRAQALRMVPPHRHGPASNRHAHEDGTATSDNWSGYLIAAAPGSADTSVSVTSVAGSWIIPEVTCSGGKHSPTEYSSFWVGIDGWNSSTVEQVGTDSDCSSGKPSYYAWYEYYPSFDYTVGGLNLCAGDQMSADVTYESGKFTVTITVAVPASGCTGGTFSTTLTPPHKSTTPQRSSAEWITEKTGALAPFGTVSFGDLYTNVAGTCYATATVGGSTFGPIAIGSFPGVNVWSSTMTEANGTPIVTPTALLQDSDGNLSSFQVNQDPD